MRSNSGIAAQAATTHKRHFQLRTGAIAGISLLVGGIGIMNIMLVSSTERIKEIPVCGSFHWREEDRHHSAVLFEAVMISDGGIIGVIRDFFAHLKTR